MKPNKRNFCGGAFPDWLEVNLTEKCNGKCSWCIERVGWHPSTHVGWWVLVDRIRTHKALNIILLGGEPLLYKDLYPLIQAITYTGKRVWITTNGGLLTPSFANKILKGITGINISIHHYNLKKNREITGVSIRYRSLVKAIEVLHNYGVSVRMNCNCIRKSIDSIESITEYVAFSKSIGADKVRFAELKQDDAGFVDLAKVLNYKYGLNDNPFVHGCNSDAVIDVMPVNFRQMCGFQTTRRVKPNNPVVVTKKVLYYDGNFYDGWQTKPKEVENMTKKELAKLLSDVENGKVSAIEAALVLGKEGIDGSTNEKKSINLKSRYKIPDPESHTHIGGFCQY